MNAGLGVWTNGASYRPWGLGIFVLILIGILGVATFGGLVK